MTGCSARWAEELALLAGGDLPTAEAEVAARDHADRCAACARLFAALAGDQDELRALRALPAPAPTSSRELADDVLAAVATEAVVVAETSSVSRTRAALRKGGWLRMAAGLAVMTAATLAILRTNHERTIVATPERLQAVVVAADSIVGSVPVAEPLPVQVRRTAGDQIELTWDGDGREGRSAQEPYQVLASSSPRDFAAAQAIEVVGHRLVATAALPSARLGDREVTYFVVR